jgi:hypothetical protein
MPVACTGIGQGSIPTLSALARVSAPLGWIHTRPVSNSSIAVAEPERAVHLAGRMALELSGPEFRPCGPVPSSKLNLLSDVPAVPWGQLAANQACGAALAPSPRLTGSCCCASCRISTVVPLNFNAHTSDLPMFQLQSKVNDRKYRKAEAKTFPLAHLPVGYPRTSTLPALCQSAKHLWFGKPPVRRSL